MRCWVGISLWNWAFRVTGDVESMGMYLCALAGSPRKPMVGDEEGMGKHHLVFLFLIWYIALIFNFLFFLFSQVLLISCNSLSPE